MSVARIVFFLLCINTTHAQTTIMIDPAGDAKRTGRIIGNSFERAITLEMAQALKAALVLQMPCSVVITRSAGELVQPLQNAQFSNRLPIDLYLNLNCAATTGPVSVYVYQFSYGEPFIQSPPQFSFIPIDTAHHCAFNKTSSLAASVVGSLQQAHAKQFHTYGPYQIPLVPLKGIKAPALSIELLLSEHQDWRPLVAPLVQAVTQAISP